MAARKEALTFLVLGVLLCCFHGVESARCTYDPGSWSDYYYTKYCSTSCCGTYPNEYCCPDTEISGGAIAGIIIGIIVFIVIVVVSVVACSKSQTEPGRVVHPNPQPTISTVSTSTGQGYTGAQPYGAQGQPPPYNPAYPPAYPPPAGFK